MTGIISASSFFRRMPPNSAISASSRELMTDLARDLGTKLDWIAVDHWNTDNPHIHILIRGRAEDGQDLVISRTSAAGFGIVPPSALLSSLGRTASRKSGLPWKGRLSPNVGRASIGRCVLPDEGAGVADLRPSALGEDPELRRLMVGRAARLERLGVGADCTLVAWTLKPGIEDKLRDLAEAWRKIGV
jgi:hypothetical protein